MSELVRIRKGWDQEGRTGRALAGPIRDLKGQDWIVVQWIGEDGPDLYKAAGLDVHIERWEPIIEAAK